MTAGKNERNLQQNGAAPHVLLSKIRTEPAMFLLKIPDPEGNIQPKAMTLLVDNLAVDEWS